MSLRAANFYEKAFRLISLPLLGLVAFACTVNHEGKAAAKIHLEDPSLLPPAGASASSALSAASAFSGVRLGGA